jgi:DnaJ family protein C protein 9
MLPPLPAAPTAAAGVKHHLCLKEYFDVLFPKVTEADIDAFEVKYKCSDEEENDVLKYCARFKGNLNKMLECVMLSSDIDKARWVEDYIRKSLGEKCP